MDTAPTTPRLLVIAVLMTALSFAAGVAVWDGLPTELADGVIEVGVRKSRLAGSGWDWKHSYSLETSPVMFYLHTASWIAMVVGPLAGAAWSWLHLLVRLVAGRVVQLGGMLLVLDRALMAAAAASAVYWFVVFVGLRLAGPMLHAGG